MKKKNLIIIASCAILIIFVFMMMKSFKQERKNFDSQLFRQSIVARFESSKEKDEYLLITRAQGYTMMIDLCNWEFVYTNEPFEGNWLYKIIYNWNGYCEGCEEIVVLVNEKSVSINGVNYTCENMEMSWLLESLDNKYQFYQKEGTGISIES